MCVAERFHVSEVSPSYWRVTFDNGPVNLMNPDTIEELGALVERIEKDPNLTVVVFRSDSRATSWPTGTTWPTTLAWRGCHPGRRVCTPTWTISCG
jgi:hypothetical protein